MLFSFHSDEELVAAMVRLSLGSHLSKSADLDTYVRRKKCVCVCVCVCVCLCVCVVCPPSFQAFSLPVCVCMRENMCVRDLVFIFVCRCLCKCMCLVRVCVHMCACVCVCVHVFV